MTHQAQGIRGTKRRFIQPPHWVVHHPVFDRKPQAMLVYMRLRTAFYEGDETVRTMTMAQISHITGVKEATLRDLLPLLDREGLLVRTNWDRLNDVPIRAFVDDAPEGYEGIDDGLDLRNRVMAGGTRAGYIDKADKVGSPANEPPTRKVTPKRTNRGKVGSSANEPGSSANEPPSSANEPPLPVSAGHTTAADYQETLSQETLLQESLSPLPLTEDDESESATPATRKSVNPAQIRQSAQNVIDGLGCDLGASAHKQIFASVQKAIASGLPPSRVLSYLKSKATGPVHSPDRLHAANARDLPSPRPEDADQWRMELCPHCDTNGLTDDPSRASRDPSARPGACLHGQPDPWDDEGRRKQSEHKAMSDEEAIAEVMRRAAELRQRKAQEVMRRRERQRARGIDCVCRVDQICSECSFQEGYSGPDLPASAYDDSGRRVSTGKE